MQPEPGIVALFYAMERAFSGKDFRALRDLFAPGLAAPFYLAEEHPNFLTDWAALEAYWQSTDSSIEQLRVRYKVQSTSPVSDELMMAAVTLEWIAHMPEQQPIGGDLRVAALCRLTGETWRLVAYVEAPLAPISYVRELYRRVARDKLERRS
jgi:hypothetical protein